MLADKELGAALSALLDDLQTWGVVRFSGYIETQDAISLWAKLDRARISIEKHFTLSDQLIAQAKAAGNRALYTFDVVGHNEPGIARRIIVEGEVGDTETAKRDALNLLSVDELTLFRLVFLKMDIITPTPAAT